MSLSTFLSYFNQKKATRLFNFLLLGDLIFILCHIFVVVVLKSKPSVFLLDAENIGFPEAFQYLKYLLVIAFTVYLVFYKKLPVYLPYIPIFLLLLVDDIFQIHAKASFFIAYRLHLHALLGYTAIMFSQVIYTLLIGSISIFLISLFYKKTSTSNKKIFIDIYILLALFMFFGVGIDIIHKIFENTSKLSSILTLVEEGGEMITLSFISWYFCFISFKTDENTYFLKDCLTKKCSLKFQ